jgi:hypothetical protein
MRHRPLMHHVGLMVGGKANDLSLLNDAFSSTSR